MNFLQSIETCFIKYVDFNGRASRPEFWWFYLFITICWIVGFTLGPVVESIIILGLVIPYISVTARRLHDRGHSGWWQILYIVPFLNVIPLYWTLRDAKDTPSALNYKNPYGSR